MKYDIVVVSGYFNPLHMGHLDYIEQAKKHGKHLVVIVNNDAQVKVKGSVPFMTEQERLKIVRGLKDVSSAVLSVDKTANVTQSLVRISKLFKGRVILFATGSDHTPENTKAEREICEEWGMDIAYGVGGEKIQSSSELLERVK